MKSATFHTKNTILKTALGTDFIRIELQLIKAIFIHTVNKHEHLS